MIINRLVISNYKNYCGETMFDFSTENNKNIVLIGGLNGSGKTTLSESIRLCLYGPRMNGPMMSDNAYQAYIKSTRCKNSRKGRMFISMDITLDDEEPQISMTVTREYIKTKDTIEERLSLTQNGKDVELIDKNYWEFYIEKIIPSDISRYFFFDGERVRDLLLSPKSSEYLSEAIRDLTGIALLEQLSKDLVEVRKRICRADIKPATKRTISSYEDRIAYLQNDISRIISEINSIEDRKSNACREEMDLHYNLSRALGAKEDICNDLKNDLEKQKSKHMLLNDQIQDFVYSTLPRIISADLIRDMLVAAKTENDSNIKSLSTDFLKNKVEEMRTKIMSIGLDQGTLTAIQSIIDNELLNDNDSNFTPPIIDLTYKQIDALQSELDNRDKRNFFKSCLRRREDVSFEIARIEKEISKFADQSMSEFTEEIMKLDSKIKSYDAEIAKKNIEIQIYRGEIEKCSAAIKEEERNLILSTLDKTAISNIDKVQESIRLRVKSLNAKSISQFETNINYIYDKLKNKDDMVRKIELLPNFTLKLVGYNTPDMDISLISEGEKGILMYSVMYSLLNLSKSKLPLIIDSPLGRMDSKHVDHLIKYFYSDIGNQVFILSHDREVTKEIAADIEPITSHIYTLYNGTPKVKVGYFEE